MLVLAAGFVSPPDVRNSEALGSPPGRAPLFRAWGGARRAARPPDRAAAL